MWDEGANAKESSAAIAERLKAGLTASNDVFADTDIGNANQALAGAAKRVEAVYSTPFVTHACMEPMNCTALVSASKAEVWVSSQNAEASLAALAAETGLPLAQCEAYNPPLGGWLRPPWWPAGLCAPGRSRGQAVPGDAGEVDLEP